MRHPHLDTLHKFGLSTTEGEIYLALALAGAPMKARDIAAATGVPRGSVYPILNALADKGIVLNGQGYGSEFAAIPAREALPRLIAAEKQKLEEAESLTAGLIKEIESKASDKKGASEANLVEVLRDPRAILERFDRLERSVKHQIDTFVKPPHFNRSKQPELENKLLQRGIRIRGIYEKSCIEDLGIKPFLDAWISAGEEARVYGGRLPHKMIIFDSHDILLPLIGRDGQMRALLVRNEELAETLILAFELIWEKSKPITPVGATDASPATLAPSTKQQASVNCRRGRSAQK